jgi:hypothetical protein
VYGSKVDVAQDREALFSFVDEVIADPSGWKAPLADVLDVAPRSLGDTSSWVARVAGVLEGMPPSSWLSLPAESEMRLQRKQG